MFMGKFKSKKAVSICPKLPTNFQIQLKPSLPVSVYRALLTDKLCFKLREGSVNQNFNQNERIVYRKIFGYRAIYFFNHVPVFNGEA